ncbi:MAG: hypothetical protein DRP63_09750 [Planctomycetota bacterium]|nr:MAG: hypothetical protein DRP63_09750 [Planctomycetota bacterium]
MGFVGGVLLAAQQAGENAAQSGGLSGLEIFLLIVVIIELLLLTLLLGSYRRLREIHFVVTESALGQVDAFVSAFGDAEQLRDPDKVALVLRELRRFMDSLQNSLRRHYERYSTEMSLLDLLPRKKAAEAPPQKPSITPATPALTTSQQEASPKTAEKDKKENKEEKKEEKKAEKEETTKRSKASAKSPQKNEANKGKRQRKRSSGGETDTAASSKP